ncbi:pyridoxal phosphate-dependent aminotransferase [Palleronia caenipelagi]|uniref:histidinol-phosphate transaminase n=1 Tax=Palleronia caenipelagi TaxID=2489174 RepID=A0A547PY47_9RHOB|nr:pyridoxal phosphate-dependent aminotransferase [Palleronia caenipelagi]TRD19019.1 pyridoxal phosphate-dependent aminotransferase [Palleronia caenipelagi]
MSHDPRLTPLIAALPATVPFVGIETLERQTGVTIKARIGANESGFGPSPRAIEAMSRTAAEAWKYPDAECFHLRHELAQHHGVGAENIVIGAGIDGLLGTLVRLTVAPGYKVVTSKGAYPTFSYHVAGSGGELVTVPYRDDHEDPEGLIAQMHAVRPKLVYISNPDNPMGSWHDASAIQRMIEAIPEGTLLVLDEAYFECADPSLFPPLDTSDKRVIRMRTFSKAYGLAGARIGYAIGDAEMIAQFSKIRDHFGVSIIGQEGARAALADQDWLHKVRAQIAGSRDRIAEIAAENGLSPLPSQTNFVAIDLGRDGDFTRAMVRELHMARIFVRMPGVAPLDRCLRVSCGTEADMDLFAQELPGALQRAQT